VWGTDGTIVRAVKRLAIAVAITAGIAGLLAARCSKQRPDPPEAPEGSWELADDPAPSPA
jgi:hypothetical protein